MGTKYTQISAVGQINKMACWAAGLKWWYTAAMSITPSQTKLYNLYKGLATQQGGMTDAGMKHIIGQNGMQLIEYPDATKFTWEKVRDLLCSGPIYTAYTESGTQKRHVNVIYGLSGDGSWASVNVMEPQAHPAGDGSFVGKHLSKPVNDFNLIGSVWAGVHRENYRAWFDCFGDV